MIIGVTDEELDVVEKWYPTKKKTGYPIVIDHGGLEQALGVPHFPYSGVIDAEGNLIYAGDSPESALKKAMQGAKPGSVWPKKLASTATLLRASKWGEAWAELQSLKTAGGLDEKEQKTLDRFTTYITDVSQSTVKAGDELFKSGMVYLAAKKLEPIAGAKPALPATEQAAKLIAEIKAVVTFDAEMRGGAVFEVARAKEDDRDFLGAVNGYRDVAKKCDGSKIADAAMTRATDLVKRGMPGYETSCDKCRKAKKACDKHLKVVKL